MYILVFYQETSKKSTQKGDPHQCCPVCSLLRARVQHSLQPTAIGHHQSQCLHVAQQEQLQAALGKAELNSQARQQIDGTEPFSPLLPMSSKISGCRK